MSLGHGGPRCFHPKEAPALSGPDSTPECPECRSHTLQVCPLSPFGRSTAGSRTKHSIEASPQGPYPSLAPSPQLLFPRLLHFSPPRCSFLPTHLRALIYRPNTFPTFLLQFKIRQHLNSLHTFPKNFQGFCLSSLWGGVQTLLSVWSGDRSLVALSFLDRTHTGGTDQQGFPTLQDHKRHGWGQQR